MQIVPSGDNLFKIQNLFWALRKLGVEEWIVRLVQGMYANARSRVRVGEGYSE